MIFEKIPAVMGAVGAVSKSRQNEQQKYKFRGIDEMYNAVHPALVENGVFIVPEVLEREQENHERHYEGKTTIWRHVSLKVAHRFYAKDGSYITCVTCGEGLDNSDKATNKAMSAAMKYALIEVLSIPTEDVEESDKSTPVVEGAKAEVAKPKLVRQSKPQTKNTMTKASDIKLELPKPMTEHVVRMKPDTGEPLIGTEKQVGLHRKAAMIGQERFKELLKKLGMVTIEGVPTTRAIPESMYDSVVKAIEMEEVEMKREAAEARMGDRDAQG